MGADDTRVNEVNGTEAAPPDAPAAAAEGTPDVAALQAQLQEAQTQAQAYMEGWQRERADFMNYKRRADREIKDSSDTIRLDMLKALLPVLDDFERALASVPADLQGNPWLNGMALVQRKLLRLLEDNGVAAVDPQGQPFDPGRHEAIGEENTDAVPSGHIAITLQKGYVWGEKVLRPALVRVAK